MKEEFDAVEENAKKDQERLTKRTKNLTKVKL